MIILIFIIYFFLVLRFTVTLFNFISNPKLTLSPRLYNDKISILIPARNEECVILTLLESIRIQDYDNYEVIVLDDCSEDNTYRLCKDFAETDSRFKVLKGEELPEGWLGKNFACHQLSLAASGNYFLFLDADEIIAEKLINNSIHRMKIGKLALLSLFTNQITVSFGEKVIVPLMHYLLLNLLPLRLVRLLSHPSFSAASGQFMLFNAVIYRQNNWHEQVKNKIVEDIEILRLAKILKNRCETLLANNYIYCRMYSSFGDALNGFSKNLLAGFGNSIIGLLLYITFVIIGPLVMILYLHLQLLLFAMTLIILSRIMISLLSGQNVWLNILLHPLQMMMFVVIAISSVTQRITKKIKWKGRIIDL